MDSDPQTSGRLIWAVTMGAVVLSIAGVLALVAQADQTGTVQPADGQETDTSGIDSTEQTDDASQPDSQVPRTITTLGAAPTGSTGPAKPPPSPPIEPGPGTIDVAEACYQVTTIPECEDLTEGGPDSQPEPSIAQPPSSEGPFECVTVTGPTTIPTMPDCYSTTESGPAPSAATTEPPFPAPTVTPTGPGTTVDICDPMAVSTTDPSCQD